MLKELFFILLFFSFCTIRAEETVAFDIYLFGNKVGEVVASHEKRTDGTDRYRLVTKASAKILWIVRNQSSTYDVVYKDGQLLSSTHFSRDNDDVKSCKVTRDANGISATNHEGKVFSYKEVPVYSIVKLYFQEPKNINHFFDESDGHYLSISSSQKGKYEFKRRNGDKSVYYYVNGVPSDLEFHTSIVSVKLKRR